MSTPCEECGDPHGQYRPQFERWLCAGCTWRTGLEEVAPAAFEAGIRPAASKPPTDDWPEWTGMRDAK